MKKLFLMFAMLLVALVTNAQFKVDSLGCVTINGNDKLANLSVISNVYGNYTEGGIWSSFYNKSSNSFARSYGMFGYAAGEHHYTPGLHQAFGVVGELSDDYGAGVYGSSIWDYPYADGRYAGYFNGNVKVTGTINGTLVSDSDERLKTNIRDISTDNATALDNVEKLFPISYNYKETEAMRISKEKSREELEKMVAAGRLPKELLEKTANEELKNLVMEKTHFGLMAQEVQKIYPNLVYENDNGTLSINYTELIPVLIQGMKELNAKVEQQNTIIRKLTTANEEMQQVKAFADGTTSVDATIEGLASMDQNVPNPFSEKTDIAIYLPESVKTAVLCIYDLNGSQISKQEVAGRGNTTMTIHADEMADGMYIYALIADGKVVTTKKMIVSK